MKRITLLLISLLCIQFVSANKHSITPPKSNKKVYFAPPNDNCANATTLTVNAGATCTSTATASFTAATASTGEVAPCTSLTTPIGGQDIWYQFTATATTHTIALSNFAGSIQPVMLVLYEGECGALTQMYCSANNVIIASGLTPGTVYKLRSYFNLASPSLTTTFNICVTTPPASSNLDCSINTINYSFETPAPPAGAGWPNFVNDNTVQGWRTTNNDHIIEFWPSPSAEGVIAFQGSQFIELNANANQGTMGVYQDYATPQSTVFTIKFAHRGRMGTDVCKLMAGPAGGTLQQVVQVSTPNTGWVHYGEAPNAAITYTVPADQPITRFYFQAVSTSTGDTSVGNYLDAIEFTAQNQIITPTPNYMPCGTLSIDVEAAGIGSWTPHADNPGTATISDPTSTNITISNFSTPGIYLFDWGTSNCISTMEVEFVGAEPEPPTVANLTYCQGQTAPVLTVGFDQGNTVGWFYGSAWHTDPPVVNTATLGTTTYYVRQTTPNGCESVSTSFTVTIVALNPSVTSFTLPAAVCAGAANVVPTPATDFTTGGVYSAGTGLNIDPATGEIDLATSTPGSYTVTYTVAANPASCLQAGSSTAPITINAAPVLAAATAIELCDNDYDGLAIFNLNPAGTQVLNGQTGYTVTYHESLAEAEAGTGAITTPGAYPSETANTQTIFIRVVQTGTTTNCYSIQTVDLIVHPKPAVPVVSNYTLCDDAVTTGEATVFNLTTKNTEAVGADATLAVTYYSSQAAAQAGTPEIPTPQAYTNTANPQTVWVRVENTFGCFSISSFNLIVNPLPPVSATAQLQECDEDGAADFTLTELNTLIIANPAGYTFTYYASQALADDASTDVLPSVYTTATTTIYVRVVNNTTGCFIVTPAQLNVIARPVTVPATPLQVCDVLPNDGIAVFDLTLAGTEVINGQTGLTVTYHTTEAAAENGTGAITTPATYTNNTAIPVIYIRVIPTGTTTNCATVEPVQLIVNPAPVIPAIADYVLCDDNNSPDGEELFDLTTLNDDVTVNPLATVTYYTSQANALAGTPQIPNPTSYQSGNATLWVRVQTQFGCFSVASFNLVVNPLPVVNTAMEPFYACEETPGQGIFNLDLIAPLVTNGAAGYTVAYYATLQQAQTGGAGLSTPYSSTTATIYVKVIDEITGCASITTADLEVLPAPIAPVVPALEECDANNDQVAVFNINTALDYILSYMGGSVTLTVHETLADATFGANPLSDAQIDAYTNVFAFTTNGVQTLYINVSSNQTECFDIAELQ
ncbi:immunoglobulin domain-containing protein, partial [Flavobacterium subsaxonicum]